MKQLIYIFLCASIVFSLFGKSEVFESNSGLPFYLTTFCLSVIIIFCSTYSLTIKDKTKITAIEFSIIVYLSYIVFHYVLFGGNVHKATQLIIFLSALIAISTFIVNGIIRIEKVYIIIASITIGELLFCGLQFFNVLPTLNENFKVTGTWVNPNISAMFIALGSASFLALKQFSIKALSNRRMIILQSLLFLICFLALVALRCRTAIIGFFSIIALAFYFSIEWRKVTSKLFANKPIKIIIALFGFAVIGLIFYQLYNWKVESVNGRLYLWERSLELIAKRPLLGYGYGMFEREYNVYQASICMENSPDHLSSLNRNGYLLSAFNEYIETWIEGGIIGLLLFSLFSFMLIKYGFNTI